MTRLERWSSLVGDWIAKIVYLATGYVWGTRGLFDAALFLGACIVIIFAVYGATHMAAKDNPLS